MRGGYESEALQTRVDYWCASRGPGGPFTETEGGADQLCLVADTSSRRPLVVKLLFRLRHPLLLQLSIELAASLNVRPVFASNELLSVLASFPQTPNDLFA